MTRGVGASAREIALVEDWTAEPLEDLELLEALAERCTSDGARRYIARLIETRARRLQELRERRKAWQQHDRERTQPCQS